MHQDLIETLEAAGSGVGAYEQFARACLARAATDRANAAFLFALGMIAQRFAAHYFERPLSVKQTEALKAKLRGHMARMKALSPDDAASRLEVLNAMIVDELEGGG